MAKTIVEKLYIKEGNVLLTLHAPANFESQLHPLLANIKIIDFDKAKSSVVFQQIHWFVTSKALLEKEISKVMKKLTDGIIVWIYFPKGTSKVQTDLSRDKGWDSLQSLGDRITWISLVSFDDTWSVFGIRLKAATDRKKESAPAPREIFKWVNPETKEIKLPDDMKVALKKDKQAATFFDSLSFSNKKEYIEWVVTAKKEETRKERITGTLERLTKQWKNPANR